MTMQAMCEVLFCFLMCGGFLATTAAVKRDGLSLSAGIGPKMCPRKLLVCFIIDTSHSMAGAKLGQVNTAIQNIVPELKALQRREADIEIFVQVISFDDVGKKLYPSAVAVENWVFVPLQTDSYSRMGEGLKCAVEVLNEFEQSNSNSEDAKFVAPVLVVLSDGAVIDWEGPLQELLDTRLGKHAQRMSFAVGSHAQMEPLESFMSPEQDFVYQIENTKDLAEMLQIKTMAAATQVTKGQKQLITGNVPIDELHKTLLSEDAFCDSDEADKEALRDNGLATDIFI